MAVPRVYSSFYGNLYYESFKSVYGFSSPKNKNNARADSDRHRIISPAIRLNNNYDFLWFTSHLIAFRETKAAQIILRVTCSEDGWLL